MSIVTAIIPCYNAAAYLGQAIESVKAQTVPMAEILVADDGSTDRSAAIAQAAGARVISTGGRLGAGAARNRAAQEAGTPYLGFLDADDCWLPEHCETVLGLLTANPAAGAAFGRIQRFGPAGDLETHYHGGFRKQATLPDLLVDNPIAQSAAIVRRTSFLAVGGYSESLRHSEDYDLWLRLAEHYAIVGTEAVTARYRVHPEQISHALPEMIRGGWGARLACRQRLQAQGGFTAVHHRRLRDALEDDVRSAWVLADRESLNLLLELDDAVGGPGGLRKAIRTRIRLLPFRRLVSGLQGALRLGR